MFNKITNFLKNETKLKIENLTHPFTGTNIVSQLIQESLIKSKTVMSWSSQKKKECILSNVYFSERNVFNISFFITFTKKKTLYKVPK